MSHRYFHHPYVKHNIMGNIFYHLFPLIHLDTLIHCTTDGNEPLREVRYSGYYLFCFLKKIRKSQFRTRNTHGKCTLSLIMLSSINTGVFLTFIFFIRCVLYTGI